MSLPTILDIAKRNCADTTVGLIDETSRAHPEISKGYARTIKGQFYRTRVRVALGRTTGSFRNANEGSDPIQHRYENRLVQTYILNPRFEVDKAVADKSEDGWEAYLADEGTGTMEGEFQGLASQFYYGNDASTGNNAKGFPGLLQAYDSTNMVVDAAGTTDNVASSVWFVKFGVKHVSWVYGENGQLDLSDVRIESLMDSNNKRFTGYVQEMLAYPGLQVGSTLSICRIKGLTTDAGKGLTDALLGKARAKFQVGIVPDAIFASRRSIEQLRASRTATNATGAEAPVPESVFGIPIYPTDAIKDTETLAL